MIGCTRYSKNLTWLAALAMVACAAGCGGGDSDSSTSTRAGIGTGEGGLGKGPAPVILGSAGNFRLLAQSAITDVPASVITGDVGLSPATGAAIGLTCVEITGLGPLSVHAVDAAGPAPCSFADAATLTTAVNDKGTAYTDANGRAPDYTELGAGNIGGLRLAPATYKWGTGVLIPSNLTLVGGVHDVWIFQIAQGLTVNPGVQIILEGGALAQNVYWATFAAASLDTTSKFKGTILSQTSISMNTGATINGRLLAGTAISLDHNTVGP